MHHTWESLSAEIDGARVRTGVQIEFVSDALAARQQRALRPYTAQGIVNRDDFRTLAVIRRFGERGASITEIAEALRSSPGTISNRVDRLHREGHLARVPHDRDRRSHRIKFTPQGTELIDEMIRAMIGVHESFLASLSDAQCEQLSALLEHCMD